MKLVIGLCLLAAAAAAPKKKDAEPSPDNSSTSSRVQEILAQADSATSASELVHDKGWSPVPRPVGGARPTQGSNVDTADLSGEDSDSDGGSGSDDASAEDEGEPAEDEKGSDSYLSPLYAPAPGGYGGHGYGGYGGYGPYIYIVPVVLPPPGSSGHHGGPVGRHVATETGHESHHYSSGGQYQPVFAGTHGVPPIYIPKDYGLHGIQHDLPHGVQHDLPHGVQHDLPHGVHNGNHGGHTTIHHQDKTIIRDINPPVFKS